MSDNLSSLVPEIYYDLIARVASGAPLILLFLWHQDLLSIKIMQEMGFFGSLAMFGASYLIGHMLTTLSGLVYIVLGREWVIRWFLNRVTQNTDLPTNSVSDCFKEVYRRIDVIDREHKTGGAILKKMDASATLSDNLFTGFIVFNAWSYFTTKGIIFSNLELAAVFIILLLSILFRRILHIGRTINLYDEVKG